MKKYYLSCVSIIDESTNKDFATRFFYLQDQIFSLTGSEKYRKQRPPHITVGMSNYVDFKQIEIIQAELEKVTFKHSQFFVDLQGFSYKENYNIKNVDITFEPYTIHVGVNPNQYLHRLVDDIDSVLRKFPIFFDIMPYKPHLTVAGRDLSKEGFVFLQKYLSNYNFFATVNINSFSLVIVPCLKNKCTKMHEIQRFYLKK